MVLKYQNEIAPIFYYRISIKTNEKDLKIPNLQAPTLGRIVKITLYIMSQMVKKYVVYSRFSWIRIIISR